MTTAKSWILLWAAISPAFVAADTGASTFSWNFNDSTISNSLAQCSKVGIQLSPLPSNLGGLGVPPYYMIAFSQGSTPTTSYIGSDPNNLSWVVNQPVGSVLVLGVADANGGAGGQRPLAFSISAGDSTCLPDLPPNNFKIEANLSSSLPLATCAPLRLDVTGGVKPYIISIAAVAAPLVTNYTLGLDDNELTWFQRSGPNAQIIVSVSDATGSWGISTGIFQTIGSTNTTCAGLGDIIGINTSIESSETSTQTQTQTQTQSTQIKTQTVPSPPPSTTTTTTTQSALSDTSAPVPSSNLSSHGAASLTQARFTSLQSSPPAQVTSSQSSSLGMHTAIAIGVVAGSGMTLLFGCLGTILWCRRFRRKGGYAQGSVSHIHITEGGSDESDGNGHPTAESYESSDHGPLSDGNELGAMHLSIPLTSFRASIAAMVMASGAETTVADRPTSRSLRTVATRATSATEPAAATAGGRRSNIDMISRFRALESRVLEENEDEEKEQMELPPAYTDTRELGSGRVDGVDGLRI